ncbi:sushi, von Willebrand factor type A, EGF and pentraxin domain-containing protein 1-like [Mercenaria mercenaria]|uniref:sushi, von Willebrand factor type A, EGF and pentraxin domain-containing protein 1-like n=1 Tax=Mercenaria mercenaria TaxID=6596 RepID=UPI00234E9500|nr:sushi, von Willebrand factor type A, EGF and pentraxin domain-containing protein 1-like [Mercenaria mercenaria]
MEIRDTRKITVVFLLTLFCGSNSSILSGLAGFGFSPLEHSVCDENASDSRTCYVSEVKNISCFTAEVRFDACKKQADSFLSNNTIPGNGPRNWTHLQAYYHRHDGSRGRPGNIGFCIEMKRGNCTQSRCLKTCCSGWEEDETGQCNKPTKSPCKNGGTYDIRMKFCMCVQGFSGQFCEIALCHRGCLNGGQCTPSADGRNLCICPQYTYGFNCQHLKCPYTCENGGHCIFDGSIPACKCPPGFYGKTCAHSYRGDSTCPPPNTTICTDLSCRDDCDAENDCPSGHVCCTDGCCTKCVKPRSPGCLVNETLYQPFDWFRKDFCTECACKHDGSIHCMTSPMSYDNSHCCFSYCRDKTTHKPQTFHRRPTINCSDEIRVVSVSRFSAYAHMDNLNIIAKDEKNSTLKVHYSPVNLILQRISTLYKTVELVRASATDSWGQIAVCIQKVLVFDRTPPRFISCPSDIYVKENKLVYWRTPRARDNVGIKSLLCTRANHRRFPVGLNTVTCTAIDYDGNKAFCHFDIHVAKTDKSDRVPPVFVSCPSDIYAAEGEEVSWKEPRVVDNFAIRSLKSNYDSHTTFPVGLTMVVYTATDYDNNKAFCSFNIFVTQKYTDTQEYDDTSKSHVTDSVKIIVATVSSLIVILVIVIVTVIIYRRYRAKPAQRSRSRRPGNNRAQAPIPSISNILYNSRDESLGVAIVPTLKPPPYSPATDPPSYDEVFMDSCPQSNAGNETLSNQPPAYESVE